MVCLGPRRPGEIVGPRPLSDVGARPLNFTVSCRQGFRSYNRRGFHMRCKLFALLLLAPSSPVWSGPIADQFSPGYEGVRWGLPLADLVGMLPEGEHYFSTAPGQRNYSVRNDLPFLGVPRNGMRVQYGFGKDGGVEWIGIAIPYDRYQQLLGALIVQFGPYATTQDVGLIRYFRWRPDQGVLITLRVTRDPRYGIAEFWIGRQPDTLGKVRTK